MYSRFVFLACLFSNYLCEKVILNSFIDMEFTYHTIHLLNVYISLAFRILRVVQSSSQPILEYFQHPRKKSHAF